MKRLILIALFTSIILNISKAQTCTPDTSFKRTGLSPDTLPPAIVNVEYNEVIQFKFPKDTMAFSQSVTIDSLHIDSVAGFPDISFTYQCNKPTRWYPGGQNGCVTITGKPVTKEVGSYKIRVYLYIVATVPGLGIYTDTTSYSLPLKVTSLAGINNNYRSSLTTAQNFPNPFNSTTEISYTSDVPAQGTFCVYDLLGKPVYQQQLSAGEGINSFIFNRGSLPTGMYFYNIALGNNVITRCMTIAN